MFTVQSETNPLVTLSIGDLELPLCSSIAFDTYQMRYPEGTHVWSTLINGTCYYTTVEEIGILVKAGLI